MKTNFLLLAKNLTILSLLFVNALSYAQLPDGQNPGGVGWADSYEANGLCWCKSTFDHDIDNIDLVSFTINGIERNIVDVCDELQYHPLVRDYIPVSSTYAGDPIYNDIQCGNGPANTAIDETQCPGRVDLGSDGCSEIGPQWDIAWLESRARFGGTEEYTPFVPDPNKIYYIDSAHHGVRLAATGNSNDAYTTTLSTIGDNVEWKFVAKDNGYWHIQRAAGGNKPRLRRDNSSYVDMQQTTSSGSWTYYEITTGDITNSYFLTLPDSPTTNNRLQINNSLEVKTVASANHNGTWESFKITEAGTITGSTVRIEAEDYDGMSGIQTENSSESGENVGWIQDGDWLRFDDVNLSGISNMDARVACNFTGGTIEVRTNSATGALIGSIAVSNTGGNQSWTTLNTSIDNADGIKDIYLVFKGGNGYLYNVNWIEFNNSPNSSKQSQEIKDISNIVMYPNPVNNITTIKGAANSNIIIYDINGGIVLKKSILIENEAIDLSNLTYGIYYAKVISVEKSTTIKLIKN